MEDVLNLYPALHEASEDKFVDVVNEMIKRKIKTTRLQYRRKQIGMTQNELAKKIRSKSKNVETIRDWFKRHQQSICNVRLFLGYGSRLWN